VISADWEVELKAFRGESIIFRIFYFSLMKRITFQKIEGARQMKRLKLIHILFIVPIISIFACATVPGMPGHVYEASSKVDNTREISMKPAWLCSSALDCNLKLALFKNSKMPEDKIVLIVVVRGAHNFSKGESLRFNADGQIFSFSSVDELTDIKTNPGYSDVSLGFYIPPSNWSSKRYIVSKNFIQKIINAKEVWARVDLSKTYVEGKFSVDTSTTARPAFREFYSRLEQL
jgi:hypothetical protein